MTGWSNQIEDKLWKWQNTQRDAEVNPQSLLLTRRPKGFVIFIALLTVIVMLITMLLIVIAILAPNQVRFMNTNDRSATRLWLYEIPGNTVASSDQANVYTVSPYGIVATVFVIISILLLISYIYAYFKDPFFTNLDKANKKQWISIVGSTTSTYFIFLIIGVIGISINNQNLFPKSFTIIDVGTTFGLSFKVREVVRNNSGMIFAFSLVPTAFGIWVVVLQIMMGISLIFWFYGLNYKIDFKNLFRKKRVNS